MHGRCFCHYQAVTAATRRADPGKPRLPWEIKKHPPTKPLAKYWVSLRNVSEAGKMGLVSLSTSLFCRILLTRLLTVPWIKFDQQLGEAETLKPLQQLREGVSHSLLQEYGHS